MTFNRPHPAAVFATVIIACAYLAGCGGLPTDPPPYRPDPTLVTVPINHAATASAKVETHIQSAENAVQAVVKVAPPAEKPLLQIASDEHAAAVKTISDDLNPQLEKAIADKAKADAQAIAATKERDAVISDWSTRYAQLEARWYVRWGRWVEAVIWWAIAAWVTLGVASILLGLGNPLGWLTSASGFILHLIPFGNIFAWFRSGAQWLWDRIQLGKQQIAAGAVPPRLVNLASSIDSAGNAAPMRWVVMPGSMTPAV